MSLIGQQFSSNNLLLFFNHILKHRHYLIISIMIRSSLFQALQSSENPVIQQMIMPEVTDRVGSPEAKGGKARVTVGMAGVGLLKYLLILFHREHI